MKLWPFGKARTEVKYSAAGPNIATWTLGRPVWTPRDYENLAREAYVQNAIAYRCVKLIASCAAGAPWLLYDGRGNEVEQHDILKLLSRPAPMTSGYQFFEAVYSYYLLAGNSYVEAVGSDRRPPKELWALRPDRMKVIPGPFAIASGYQYTVNGLIKEWKADPLTGDGQILHMKDFHPIDDFYGMSRVEPAAYGIDRHNAASAHNKALLDNGARPSGALVFEPVKVGENEYKTAPQPLIDDARAKLESHVGTRNAGKPMVFGGNVNWLEMGINPKDMDFGDGKNDAARDICTSFGVPHILIVPGSSTYNNVREAKLELYEETVLPLVDFVANNLNMWLCPRYGDGLRLEADRDGISALEPRREARRSSVVTLLKEGVIDDTEARDALQYGPREKSAVKKVDATVLKALVDTVDQIGFEPLVRYMKSVGLYDAGMTTDEVIQAATAHMSDPEYLAASGVDATDTQDQTAQQDTANAQL